MRKITNIPVLFILLTSCGLACGQGPVFNELIHASKIGNDVYMEWQPAVGADGYNIYRFDAIPTGPPPYPVYATVSTPGFTDTGAVADPTFVFYYIVTAYNTNGETEARNWAFRLNVDFVYAPGTLGNHQVSLPYIYHPGGISDPNGPTVEDVCRDAGPNLNYVAKWEAYSDTWFLHSCGSPLRDIPIDPGMGYLFGIGNNFTFSVVGSHDPDFEPGGPSEIYLFCSLGTLCNNWVSVPYHSVAGGAITLCDEWQNRGDQIMTINRWVPEIDVYFVHPCGTPLMDFDLTPGQAIMVQPATDENISIEVN
ncbi:hypothetical protein ACFLU6_05605 [Acidobacteriota bacterium]